MKKKILFLIIIILVVLLVAYFIFNKYIKPIYSPDKDLGEGEKVYYACSGDRCLPTTAYTTRSYCSSDDDCKKKIPISRICNIPIINLLCIN